ncbi:MAG TPA: phytanoyl-CoA dioxygenase family protein [Polyangiaceae bacterium]|jgi:ectoine hydroxylase-related dioxygenase (phytanoyl-CoA dioxygenase family)|nr:phytanoyl-CoA dioxygenase family protein [Polyangiaceae bacterium]
MLTHREIERYRADGYLVVDDVFSPSELQALRTAADDPELGRKLDDKGYREQGVHLLELTTHHAVFRELARDARLTDRVAQLIGADLQLQHSKLATKPPKVGAGEFRWHQDFPYFPHTNFDLLAIMVMLDDATPENGCMSVVPGSHKLGPLSHLVDGYFDAGCQEPRHWADSSRWATLTPRAGGISIHHCLTLHTSPNNTSGKPRRGLVFQYRADDAAQLYSHVYADTGFQVRGKRRGVIRFEPYSLQLPLQKGVDPAPATPYFQVGAQAQVWNRDEASESKRCA